MIIGREYQQKLLTDLLDSDESQFVAVYGRRRVGKTYLIRETFKYNFAFQHIGIQDGNKARQLSEFALSLQKRGNGSSNPRSRKTGCFQTAFPPPRTRG